MPKRKSKRRAAVAIEFALTAPVFFLFMFSCLEFARVCMIRSTIENAAFEGARTGIVPGSTKSSCEAAAEFYLDIVGINNRTVTCNTLTNTTDEVTVTVSVPIDINNGYLTPRYFLGSTLSSTITLTREPQQIAAPGP